VTQPTHNNPERGPSGPAPKDDPFAGRVADPGAARPDAPEAVPDTDSVTDAQPSADHAKLTAERDQYLDALQRLKAEFDNYRKRVDRDREAQQVSAVRDLVAELLPVIDNLERAIANSPDDAATEQILTGVEMVRTQLRGVLSGRGVHEIEADGSVFDPEVHDAVAQHPSDEHDEGTVVHVLERGYRLGETVIRPAKVVVAAPPPGGSDS